MRRHRSSRRCAGLNTARTVMTICARVAAGVEETTRRAAAFIQEILPGTTVSPPRVASGEVILSF